MQFFLAHILKSPLSMSLSFAFGGSDKGIRIASWQIGLITTKSKLASETQSRHSRLCFHFHTLSFCTVFSDKILFSVSVRTQTP